MKLLDYYKNYLNKDIVKVEEIYCSMNLTDDTSGIEFFDRVTCSNGKQEYYIATFQYDHSLENPVDFPEEWLKVADITDQSDFILPDNVDSILNGKGW